MIYITGDTHGNFHRFSTKRFPEQKEMSRDDIVIVCGDFGGVWCDCKSEQYWLNWLEQKPFTICFVDGNHSNFDRLYSDEFEIVNYHGGKAHKIRDNIYHLMRGYVFDFEGKKFFCFGGAASHDIQDGIINIDDFKSQKEFKATYKKLNKAKRKFRVNHTEWWKEELPSQEEMDFGLKTLEDNNFEVDYIIAHCAPQMVVSTFGKGCYQPDILTMYFNEIAYRTKFHRWFFGHYHDELFIMGKFICHYERIERIL